LKVLVQCIEGFGMQLEGLTLTS